MDQQFKFLPALIALVGVVLIQISVLVNDYSDFETGADDETDWDRSGCPKGLVECSAAQTGAQVSSH